MLTTTIPPFKRYIINFNLCILPNRDGIEYNKNVCYYIYSLFQICNDVAFVSVEDTTNSIDSCQQHESTLPSMTSRLIIMKYAFEA